MPVTNYQPAVRNLKKNEVLNYTVAEAQDLPNLKSLTYTKPETPRVIPSLMELH